MDKSIIHSFLRQHRYAVISSLAANNTPESALIGIAVSANLEIIFDTLKSSRKYPISSPIRIALSSSAGKTNQLSNSRAGPTNRTAPTWRTTKKSISKPGQTVPPALARSPPPRRPLGSATAISIRLSRRFPNSLCRYPVPKYASHEILPRELTGLICAKT
jgi:hypothetical protein